MIQVSGQKVITFNEEGKWQDGFFPYFQSGESITFRIPVVEEEKVLAENISTLKNFRESQPFDKSNLIVKFLLNAGFDSITIEKIRKEDRFKNALSVLEKFKETPDYYLKINGKNVDLKDKVDNYFEFKYPVNNTDSEIKFELIRNNQEEHRIAALKKILDKQNIFENYNTIADKVSNTSSDLERIIQSNKRVNILSSFCDTVKPKVIEQDACYLKGTQLLINSYLPWMSLWLWKTKNEFKLNPLAISGTEISTDKIERDITVLKKEISATEELLRKPECCDSRQNNLLLDGLYVKYKRLEDSLFKVKEINKSNNKLAQESLHHKPLEVTLHAGVLFPTRDADHINWLRMHDASENYSMVNEKAHPSRYYEEDKVYILGINLTGSSKPVLEESLAGYTSQSDFTVEISEALSYFAVVDEIKKVAKSTGVDMLVETGFVVGPTTEQYIFLHSWFVSQSNPERYLKLKFSPRDTVFRSATIGPSKVKEASTIVTYNIYIFEKENPKVYKIENLRYRIYKTHKLQPHAGIVYTLSDRTSPLYDASTQTFSEKNIGRSDVLVGVKFYPFKTNIEYRTNDRKKYRGLTYSKGYNWRRGNNLLINRLAVSVGVGLEQNPLNNWFTGITYDFVPGFAANFGVNLYSRNYYNLVNGTIASQSSRLSATTYLGITVDPVVLLKYLQIFQPKI